VEDREERYALTDIFYKSHGAMSLKFGFDYSHAVQNVLPLFASLGGQYAFSNIQTNSTGTSAGTGGSPFASFMLGVVNGTVTLRNAQIPYYYRWNSYAGFIQNDWKVRPNLTLNIGVRYSVQMPRTEKYDHQGVYRLDMINTYQLPTPLKLQDGNTITSVQSPAFVFAGHGNSRYMTPTDYMNFEPRFGFAWSPSFLSQRRLTLRGGYGLSHAPITGMTRLPQPDFGATVGFASAVPSATVNPNYVMRLGENPPLIIPQTPDQVINAPANGIVTTNSLYYQQGVGGYAISSNYHTPYIQNWNVTLSWQLNHTTTMEIGYTGLKGTRLFMPHENINPKVSSYLDALNAANVVSTNTIADPLGRINPSTGQRLTVQNGSLESPYLGFSSLYVLYDASANSIRHGGYVNFQHRVSRGLTWMANYTWAKSIDDASSSGGDKNILTAVNGQTDGQVAFGAPRYLDRSVSTYDQRHVINSTLIYDLPFGRGRHFGNGVWKPVDFFIGGWTLSAIERLNSGFPYAPALADSNQIGDLTHTARPNMAPGVPLLNPLWDRNCPVGAGCQPYVNPAAFERPALGQIGNAPRTLDGARGPWAQILDFSVQKSWRLGEGKRRLQFRADGLNVLNHPVFRVFPNNAGGTDFMGAPSTAALSAADYNTWATANNQPLASTTAGTALLNQINAMVNSYKNGAGVLPTNFFSVPLASNFFGKQPSNFDITTVDGFKQFRLRQAYNTSFGTLYQRGGSRYVQFGLKLFF
jgi:hypothetical protein